MNHLSELTTLKVKILEEGVQFSPLNIFTEHKKKDNFRSKTIFKKPVSDGKRVFDMSTNNELIPSEIILRQSDNESIVKCRYKADSSVELRLNESTNTIDIYLNGTKCETFAEFVYDIEALNIKIDDTHTVGDYIDVVGLDRIALLLFEGCHNWICGKQCKFCDLHPKRVDEKVIKPTLNNLYLYPDVDTWWNEQKAEFISNTAKALKILMEHHTFKHNHLFIMAGNLDSSEKVWDYLIEFTEGLAKEVDLKLFDSIVNVCPHDTIEHLEKIKSLGIKQVQYNLEIANKEIFEFSCPGKIAYEDFVSKMYEAVTIMGKNNVRSNFVLGLQDIDELLSEADTFASAGIITDYSVFQPKKHTPYEDKPAPTMEQVIYFTDKLADIYLKYGQVPIFCSLSSRSSIMNEVYYDKSML